MQFGPRRKRFAGELGIKRGARPRASAEGTGGASGGTRGEPEGHSGISHGSAHGPRVFCPSSPVDSCTSLGRLRKVSDAAPSHARL